MESDEMRESPENPFNRRMAMIDQVFFTIPTVIAYYAIAKHKPKKLPLFTAGNAFLYIVMRRFVCARCQYYGQPCSTMLGVMASKIMPRDESKGLDRNALIADFAFLFALGFYAMPEINKSLKLAFAYNASVVAALGAILFNACGVCGNDFCPMKDLRRTLTKNGS